MTLATVEARFKSPRGLLALWLVGTGAAAVVALLMQRAGVPGWDDAAHAYRIYLLQHGAGVLWDDYWYGGGYGAVNYGVLFYLLAIYVPAKLIAVASAGAVPILYYLYQRDMWHIDDVWPAWLLALGMTMYLAHGQDPFLLGLALTLGGLALLARGRPVLAALPVAAGVFSNPMAFIVCSLFMVTDVVSRPEARRRYFVFFAVVTPFVLVRVASGWAFTEPGSYLNETTQLLLYLGFALAGVALAGVNAAHERRPFIVLFLLYAAVCVGSFVTPGSPLGNNIGRFFFVFGLPLLFLLRHSKLRRPYPSGDLAMIPVVLFGLMQVGAPYSHFTRQDERPQTRASFFAPALDVAARRHDLDHRVHVVALRRHWESYFFPEAGYPITRGWYRQADAIHNGLFYGLYDATSYAAWLRRMGVEYVYLADAPLDQWSRREARILKSSPDFEVTDRAGDWTVYRLREAEPLVVGLDGGVAHVREMRHGSFVVAVGSSGRYLVKVTWSPYWSLEGGEARLGLAPGRQLLLTARSPGTYTVRFEATPGKVLEQVEEKLPL